MANIKGSSSIRNAICNGKHSLLPPKIPFPSIAPSFVDYVPSIPIGMKGIPKPRGVNSHHQRTSSESFLMEEQPSWLDELLNEPETPVCKAGHRRSSSDSFAYVDVAAATAIDYIVQDQNRCRNLTSVPSWESQDFGHFKDVRHASFYRQQNCLRKSKNRAWHSSLVSMTHPNGLPSARDIIIQTSQELCDSQEADGVPSAANACEKQDFVESGQHDPKAISERKYYPDANLSVSETDEKRSKQQFAQRSRVWKLQYITELERNVQALQADGSEISAELEFRNQRTVILSMENKALKQRLDSLAQEQLIKRLEHEVLEREIGRLRSLYQQRQQQPFSTHGRTNSRDLDSQFANLSLKHKDAASGRETISGPLHI